MVLALPKASKMSFDCNKTFLARSISAWPETFVTAAIYLKTSIVYKNCLEKLSTNIVFKNCLQKLSTKIVYKTLPTKIVYKNCSQKLSTKIVYKNIIVYKKCQQKLSKKMSTKLVYKIFSGKFCL